MRDNCGGISKGWAAGMAALWVLLNLAPPLFSGESGSSENRVAIEKWVYSRERKTLTASNRVIANFNVTNVTDKTLEKVTVRVTLISGLGEKVAGPLNQELGSIKPRAKAAAQVSASMVPAFGAYEIVVSYQGGSETWYSNSDISDPQPKPKGLAEGTARVVVVGQEVGPDGANQLAGQVRVRNEGALEANDVKMVVTYWGADRGGKKAKLGEWTGPLGNGKIPPGRELTFPVRVPQRVPPGMATFELKVVGPESSIEAQMAGGDFTGAKDVEVAQWKFKRVGEKQQDLEVSCKVRNGLSADVHDVRLTVDFLLAAGTKQNKVKSFPHTVAGPLKAGEVATTSFVVKGLANYDSYECAVSYGGGGVNAVDPGANAVALKEPVRSGKATVEVLYKSVNTDKDGTVMVSCAARNGLAHQVKDVNVLFRLLKQDGSLLQQAEKKLEDPLLPGEEAPFVIRVPKGAGYASYDSQVTFAKFNGPLASAPQVNVPALSGVSGTALKAAAEPKSAQSPAPVSQRQAVKTDASASGNGGPIDLP